MTNQNSTEAILELWKALEPQVEALIAEKTRNCVRAQRAVVVTAPNNVTGKIGVRLPFDSTTLSLPFSSAVSSVTVGTQVWILMPYDNSLTNGVVVQNGTWTL